MDIARKLAALKKLTAVACLIAIMAADCCAQDPGSVDDSEDTIQQAVNDLSSEDFATREQATQKLLKIGLPAAPALEAVYRSGQLEIRRRSRWLLERILVFNVAPTPEIERLVQDWSFSHENHTRVFDELIQVGDPALPVLRGMLRLAEDYRSRRAAENAIMEIRRREIWPALDAGDLEKAELLLREARFHPDVTRHYAVFFLLTGRIDQEIERVRAELAEVQPPGHRLTEVLVYCLRAAGRHREALQLAKTIPERIALDALWIENGRWSELADSKAIWPSSSRHQLRPAWRVRSTTDRGFLAVCLRRAGRQSECDRILAELTQKSRRLNPNRDWEARECPAVLLINEQPDLAVDVMADLAAKSHLDRVMAIRLLCLQERHATAFELAGLPVPDASKRAEIIAEHAKQLAGLGERDDAAELLRPHIARAGNDSSPAARTLIRMLISIGRVSEGLEHVARRLETSVTDPARRTELQAVYASPANYGRPASAPVWLKPSSHAVEIQRLWGLLPDCYPEDPPAWQLARLRHLLGLPVEHDWDNDDRLETTQLLAKIARERGGVEQPFHLKSIAYALILMKQGDRARELLSEAIELREDISFIQLYADSLAHESRWSEAVTWFERALERVPQNSFFEFALAYCRDQAGEPAGREAMNRACLPFLGKLDDRVRAIDNQVRDRNWKDAHVRLARLAFNTHEPGSHHILNAAGTLGNSINTSDPRRAVEMWELLQLSLTTPSILRYIRAFEQILLTHEVLQRIKARDLGQRNQVSEMESAAEAARRTLPGGVLIALECVPRLREAGRTVQADRLIQQIAAVNESVLQEFPNSHRHHYRLARLSAELDWDRDTGLRHAEAAVELLPTSTSYRATLKKLRGEDAN